MSKNGRKSIKWICIIIGAILLLPMIVNWLMTYKLEDSLRRRLRLEVIEATDGFYDFSFDKLKVGLFTGELMIEGVSLWPDSSALQHYTDSAKLPKMYFEVYIDTIDFKGINLTWLSNYRKLTFDQFLVKHPSIKIVAPNKGKIATTSSSSGYRSLHQSIAPYFDAIKVKYIDFKRAHVEYIVEDSITSHYMLRDFEFTAHKFVLDEHSQNKEHLLFSDNFDFQTSAPQTILDSKYFKLDIGGIKLSTVDSTVYVQGANLASKEKYWERRYEEAGSYTNVLVGGLELNGIAFSRQGAYNFLDARELNISGPSIDLYRVDEEKKEKIRVEGDTLDFTSWSLYTLTSPIMERIAIDQMNIDNAKFTYTRTKDKQSDLYTLNKLDFKAYAFLVDSLNGGYNIFNYVKNFSIDATDVQGHLNTKNNMITVDKFRISSLSKSLFISDIQLFPISLIANRDYIHGKIDEFEITGIQYNIGLDADLIRIESPKINYFKAKNPLPTKGKNNSNTQTANKMLDAIAPFISHVSVKDILINDGNATFIDRKDNNKYFLSNLDFYAKNFHIDKETRHLRDYFFGWDEYSLKFRNFDNLTPDKKYRIRIAEGDFNSVTGNMLLRDMQVTAEKDNMGSYINFITPYATLLGWDDKGIRNKKLSFKTFILDSPVVEIIKKDDQVAKNTEADIKSLALDLINFDLLTIPSPSIYFHDETKGSSFQAQAIQMHIDSFRWELSKKFNIHNFIIESPYISMIETKESTQPKKEGRLNIASFGDIDIRRLNITTPVVKIKTPSSSVDFSADNYLLKSLFWNHRTNSLLEIKELDFSNPSLLVSEKEKKEKEEKPLTKEEIIKTIAAYANKTNLGRINISNLNLSHSSQRNDGTDKVNNLINTDLLIEELHADLDNKKLNVGELAFSTHHINIPVADNFYNLKIDHVNYSKRKGELNINDIRLNANYPKFDFAYMHPTGADWFNVEVGNVALSGIDASRFYTDTILLVKKMRVNDVTLENLKNQKIDIEHNIMPLLYEEFQRFPLKYNIDDLDIRDFTVIYEELANTGYEPARIPFANMNGRVKSFTNIQQGDSSFYTLHADGLAMGTAPFVAEWKIPVDSTNDKFYLTAEIQDLDMRDFNQLIRPMAPAYVKHGIVKKLNFQTEATSLGATVDMEFVYDSLYLVILKNIDGDEEHKTLTHLINRWGIKQHNFGQGVRTPHNTIVRDPYHSNFNYFWQILQPPLVESIGVSQEKQNLAQNLVTIINRIKRFFGGGKKKEKKIDKE